jgi:uncharacterized protein (DUF1800 family)
MNLLSPTRLIIGLIILAAFPALAQDTRLSSVAVRTSTGGGDTLITGFTIGPGPTKRVLIRAVGPALTEFGVPGALTDPRLEVYNSAGTKIAENDNWTTDDAATFATVGAFPLRTASKDAALVINLPSGGYTVHVTGIGNSGQALVEVYEVSGGVTRLVSLSTRANVGTGANILIPGISISPGAGTRRLLVRAVGPSLGAFGVPGTLADPKLELFSGSSKIAENDNWGTPVSAASADAATLAAAFANNGAFPLAAGSKDAALLINLAAGGYTLQVSGVGNTTGAALVEVYDLTPVNQTGAYPSSTLYVAQLRPDPTATGSTASGYATILINPDRTATVNASFSNLSSAQTSAHLQLGTSRDYVLNLPLGQVVGRTWTFAPSGTFTTNDLINALNGGNIFVGLDSARFPGGELRGNFVPATGSQTFSAPAAPPALAATALTNPTATDAARFLTQATFGPSTATITALTARGIPGWIDEQLAAPVTSALAALRADVTTFPNGPVPAVMGNERFAWKENWHAAWWKIAITAPDQLRQRVAFALSEILVVGQQDDLDFNLESKAKYYDLLVSRAFGNYRTLIEEVTLNPAMGLWLSHRGNPKANPVKGTAPDENYARELQQLFTIGLVQLQPDGTLMLDAAGQPIPTYDQAMISETAKVLTGWTYAGHAASLTNENLFTDFYPPVDVLKIYPAPLPDTHPWLVPMTAYEAFHDRTEKRIVSLQQVAPAQARPTVIPAGQTAPQDLKILLDTLFNHPNVGPFLSRQLIQRLVTSNPSPGYVYRVAQKFADNGAGVRGDLGAVVRAILTDYEARSPAVLNNFGYGKIKEPLLRLSGFMRAFNVAAPNGRYMDSYFGEGRFNSPQYNPSGMIANPGFLIGQQPLDARTVFNFFSSTYSPPGAMAAAGLVAPELEITDSNYAIQVPNQLVDLMYRNPAILKEPPAGGPSPFLRVDYSALLPNARNPAALVDQLNLLICANQMTAATRTQIITTLNSFAATATDLERVHTAIQFTVNSPDGALQK